MSGVRVLVGTRKGAFIMTSDASRARWDISGPHFPGWEIYHLKGSPVNPDRLYASQTSGWFGQVIQRSDDGGKTWEPVGNQFAYDGVPGTHQWYDGTQHPWEFTRVWYLEPSLSDPETVYAGVEDAALFRSSDGGQTWQELPGCGMSKATSGRLGAGGMCLHTILQDPNDPNRIYIAISAAGAFRTDDGGTTWRPINRGLQSNYELPDPNAEVGHCVHNIAMHPSRPGVLFMQKHWDVCAATTPAIPGTRSAATCPATSGFRLPFMPTSRKPSTSSRLRATQSTTRPKASCGSTAAGRAGTSGRRLQRACPRADCYVNVLRSAMTVDSLDPCGVYFGTTGGQVYVSADSGDNWDAYRPGSASSAVGRSSDAAMIRVVLPTHLRTLARVSGEVVLEVDGDPTLSSVLDALEARYPMLRGTIRDHTTRKRRDFIRFFASGEDLSHEPHEALLPEPVASGVEPIRVVGAMAGG
jgi:hypothetical protein